MKNRKITQTNHHYTDNLKRVFSRYIIHRLDLNLSFFCSRLRERPVLNDVTLVCQDNTKILAHKLILSSFSEYYRKIFKHEDDDGEKSVIHLPDVEKKLVDKILDFIYIGVARVRELELPKFTGN